MTPWASHSRPHPSAVAECFRNAPLHLGVFARSTDAVVEIALLKNAINSVQKDCVVVRVVHLDVVAAAPELVVVCGGCTPYSFACSFQRPPKFTGEPRDLLLAMAPSLQKFCGDYHVDLLLPWRQKDLIYVVLNCFSVPFAKLDAGNLCKRVRGS